MKGGGKELHFTVGSLRHTKRRPRGPDFRGELGLLKAAILYADHVQLVSVGGSTVATLDKLRTMPTPEKLELVREQLPFIKPDASGTDVDEFHRMLDVMSTSSRRGKRGRGLSEQERVMLRRVDNDLWMPIQRLVEGTLDEWGAVAFKVALRSGLVDVRPFAATTPQKLLELGRTSGRRDIDLVADNAYEEYRDTILDTVGDGATYPLFDDLTGGEIVARAVKQGVIRPSSADKRRGKQAGLAGNLLQELPMFEKAGMSQVLEIREELSEHLGAFRQAVAEAAATIESASWDVKDFADEAHLVFQETVAPAVGRIDDRVCSDRDLKELSYRYGPSLLSGAAGLGAFIGSGSALGALVSLASGLASGWQVAASRRQKRTELAGERLYFYYRAERMLGRRR